MNFPPNRHDKCGAQQSPPPTTSTEAPNPIHTRSTHTYTVEHLGRGLGASMTRCGEGGGEARGSNPSIVFEFPIRHRRVCVWVNRQHPPSPPPIRRKAPGDHAQSTPESTNHNASLAVRGAGASRGRGVPNGGWPEQATDRHHPPHGLAVWNCEVEGPKFAVTVSPGMRRNESLPPVVRRPHANRARRQLRLRGRESPAPPEHVFGLDFDVRGCGRTAGGLGRVGTGGGGATLLVP